MGFEKEYNKAKEKYCFKTLIQARTDIHYASSSKINIAGCFDQCQESMSADNISIFDKWIEEEPIKFNFPLNSNFD